MKERVRELCKIRGTSIPNLEKTLGFSTGSISKWDKSFPGSDKLEKVAEHFNVSTDYLLGRTEFITCSNCGYSYDPLNLAQSETHANMHRLFNEAKEKIGFCYTPSQSISNRITAEMFLNDGNLPDEGQVAHVETLLKADYSDHIRENNFVIDISYSDFCIDVFLTGRYLNMISSSAKKILFSTYGVSEEKLLNKRDKRDIKKDLDSIMKKLSNQEYGPAAFEGDDLSPEAAELFKDELEIALKRLKLINKEKYNPHKNKE